MLHLQARIHFQEIPGGGVVIVDELHRAGGLIVHGTPQAEGGIDQAGARRVRKSGRRCFLDHLLIAALGGAIALAQRHYFSCAIAEDLHLDVACILHEFFQVETGSAETRVAQALDGFESGAQFPLVAAEPHPNTAATRCALEHHRIADGARLHRSLVYRGKEFRAGQQGHAALRGDGTRGVLQTEIAQVRGRGSDEYDAASRAGLGECGALAEKAIAGVDGLRAGAHSGIEQRFHGEIALRRRGRTDLDRFIRRAHMERVAIGRGIDSHRGHGHTPQGAYDAAGDGAAVRDEYLAEHQFSAGFQISTCTGVGS